MSPLTLGLAGLAMGWWCAAAPAEGGPAGAAMSPLTLGLAGLAMGWWCAAAPAEGGPAASGDRPSATGRVSTASPTGSAGSFPSATPRNVERSAPPHRLGGDGSPTGPVGSSPPAPPVGAERPPPPATTGLDAFLTGSLGSPASTAPQGAALARRTEEVAALLRCPVCQGTSVADSPSTLARTMKAQVRALLAQGFDEEQVLRYFELSYGESVRMRPKAEGLTALLWVLPLAFVGIGVLVLARAAWRLQRGRPAPP